jgi:hypothetical protein
VLDVVSVLKVADAPEDLKKKEDGPKGGDKGSEKGKPKKEDVVEDDAEPKKDKVSGG